MPNTKLSYLSGLKRIVAILFLGLMLFNWGGYRLLTNWLQAKTETRMEAAIDQKAYNSNNIIELSVATNLPYTNDWKDWERISGSISVNGLTYQYIERKMEKGNMRYRCLPNAEKQNLLAARDEFFQLVNNFNQHSGSKKGSSAIAINNYIGDYDDAFTMQVLPSPELYPISTLRHWPDFVAKILENEMDTPHQPPSAA